MGTMKVQCARSSHMYLFRGRRGYRRDVSRGRPAVDWWYGTDYMQQKLARNDSYMYRSAEFSHRISTLRYFCI